jgi:hypothetical protein
MDSDQSSFLQAIESIFGGIALFFQKVCANLAPILVCYLPAAQ